MTYRHFVRYRQIIAVLFKYGFEDVLGAFKIDKYIDISNIDKLIPTTSASMLVAIDSTNKVGILVIAYFGHIRTPFR